MQNSSIRAGDIFLALLAVLIVLLISLLAPANVQSQTGTATPDGTLVVPTVCDDCMATPVMESWPQLVCDDCIYGLIVCRQCELHKPTPDGTPWYVRPPTPTPTE